MHVRTVLKVATLLAFCAAGAKSQDSINEEAGDSVGCTIVVTVTNTESLPYCDDSSELDIDSDLLDSSSESSGAAAAGYINQKQGSILAGILAAGFLVAASIV